MFDEEGATTRASRAKHLPRNSNSEVNLSLLPSFDDAHLDGH